MELVTAVSTVVGVIGAVITASGYIYGFYQSVRRKQYAKAWEDGTMALTGMAAAVELMPSADPRVQQIKQIIRAVSAGINTEKGAVSNAVKQVESLLRERGFVAENDETSPDQIERAVAALKEYKLGLAKEKPE